MRDTRPFVYGVATSAVLAIASVAVWYVFLWPTSDVRVRMYILLYAGSGPTGPFLVLWATLALIGAAIVRATGWRGGRPMLGAALGASLGVVVLWSRLMGYYVWLHAEQVTLVGQLVRATLAAAVAGVVVLWARRGARRQVAA